jgi:hypothetical protein
VNEREVPVTRIPFNPLSDEELMRLVAEVIDEDEPLPPGALEFASNGFVWRDINSELAQLLHDSARGLVEVRAGATARVLMFQQGEVILDLEHDDHGMRGAVSPPAGYRVELASAAAAVVVQTDSTGMFAIDERLGGTAHVVVFDAAGDPVLVTQPIEL